MRLIDADATIISFERAGMELGARGNLEASANYFIAARALRESALIKTIEAEPVRHGRWVRNDLGETYCSECHSRIPYFQCYDSYPDCCMDDEDMQWDEEIERTSFCPHCGAKMDLEG